MKHFRATDVQINMPKVQAWQQEPFSGAIAYGEGRISVHLKHQQDSRTMRATNAVPKPAFFQHSIKRCFILFYFILFCLRPTILESRRFINQFNTPPIVFLN
jgi:hypothetical protein